MGAAVASHCIGPLPQPQPGAGSAGCVGWIRRQAEDGVDCADGRCKKEGSAFSRLLSSWPVAALAGGGGQPVTPTDGSVTVQATCPGGDADVYLVTELFFDSGFSTSFVSGNSIPVECGGNLSGEFLLEIRNSFQAPARGGKNR